MICMPFPRYRIIYRDTVKEFYEQDVTKYKVIIDFGLNDASLKLMAGSIKARVKQSQLILIQFVPEDDTYDYLAHNVDVERGVHLRDEEASLNQ